MTYTEKDKSHVEKILKSQAYMPPEPKEKKLKRKDLFVEKKVKKKYRK